MSSPTQKLHVNSSSPRALLRSELNHLSPDKTGKENLNDDSDDDEKSIPNLKLKNNLSTNGLTLVNYQVNTVRVDSDQNRRFGLGGGGTSQIASDYMLPPGSRMGNQASLDNDIRMLRPPGYSRGLTQSGSKGTLGVMSVSADTGLG